MEMCRLVAEITTNEIENKKKMRFVNFEKVKTESVAGVVDRKNPCYFPHSRIGAIKERNK